MQARNDLRIVRRLSSAGLALGLAVVLALLVIGGVVLAAATITITVNPAHYKPYFLVEPRITIGILPFRAWWAPITSYTSSMPMTP